MKRKGPVLITLVVVFLMMLLFNACAPRQAEKKLEQIENKIEFKIDTAQDTLAAVVRPADSQNRLTVDEAKAAAMKHAGLTDQQVSWLRAEFDVDDRIPHYDVEFCHDGFEYDCEIHAEDGSILSFDKDKD